MLHDVRTTFEEKRKSQKPAEAEEVVAATEALCNVIRKMLLLLSVTLPEKKANDEPAVESLFAAQVDPFRNVMPLPSASVVTSETDRIPLELHEISSKASIRRNEST